MTLRPITDYINFCVECNILSKTVKCYPNNKPWVTKDLKLLINQKKAAFHSNDTNNLRTINEQLKKAIESKKKIYKEKIEDQLKSNDSRKAWDGLKNNYWLQEKIKSAKCLKTMKLLLMN